MSQLSTPIAYSAELEQLEPDEANTIRELSETMAEIRRITFEHSGEAIRSVHAKSHGLIEGELQVLDNLPATLRQGLFADVGRYRVLMRLSTPPGDLLSDRVSLPRGMAIKICGVPGERLEGSERDDVMDLVMVNGPAFMAPDLKGFLKNLKMLAATTDKAAGAKQALSMILRGTEKALEAVGGESSTLKSLGGHPMTDPLGETYYTQVPLRFGEYVGKLALAPVSPELTARTDAPLANADRDNALRESVVDFFRDSGATWELRVQLCRNLETMPIEDASVIWPENESPYLPIARVEVSAQTAWDERTPERERALSFGPWHGLQAHRPLGAIMRGRKRPYEESAAFRGAQQDRTDEEMPDPIPSGPISNAAQHPAYLR